MASEDLKNLPRGTGSAEWLRNQHVILLKTQNMMYIYADLSYGYSLLLCVQ